MAFLDVIFNPIFLPILNLSPLWGTIILAFIITLIITLAYKYLTNQELMKKLKEEQKEFQKKLKELKSNPEEMMKVQKEAMRANMEYMKHSFKPTLITFLPILLILGWMTAHLSYEPIYPGETYSITAEFREGLAGTAELIADNSTTLLNAPVQNISVKAATWSLKGSEGEHYLTVKQGNSSQTKKIVVSKGFNYEEASTSYLHSDIEKIQINYLPLKLFGPKFSLWGWQPGWLGTYIVFSIIFSLVLRKVLKIY